MPIRVANIRKHIRTEGEVRVYVGRAAKDYDASPLANPFRVQDGGRDVALTRYRNWLQKALSERLMAPTDEIIRIAMMVAGGADVVLLCWCAPAKCHADIIKVAVERLAGRLGPSGTVQT